MILSSFVTLILENKSLAMISMFLPWAREPPPTIEIFAPKLSARIKIALLVSYSNVSEIVSPPFIRSRSQSSVIIFPKTGSCFATMLLLHPIIYYSLDNFILSGLPIRS